MAFLAKTACVKDVLLMWTRIVLCVRVGTHVKNANLAFSQMIANVCLARTVLAKSVICVQQVVVLSARRVGLFRTANVSNVASLLAVSTISATKMAVSSVKRDSTWTKGSVYHALLRFQGAKVADQPIYAPNVPLTS